MTDLKAKRAAFRSLHEEGCFVLPNPWDVGGVRRLEKLGFAALASTSAGMAWALGLDDGEVARDDVLSHLRLLCASTDLPVNADFEAGFADEPEEVAANVRLACDTGIAGLSIEDRTGRELYPLPLAARAHPGIASRPSIRRGRMWCWSAGRRVSWSAAAISTPRSNVSSPTPTPGPTAFMLPAFRIPSTSRRSLPRSPPSRSTCF